MSRPSFISIDQNTHSLWDTIPKLQALVAQGYQGTHCVEDVDVAFTRRGAEAGDDTLELARERVYRGGTSDWGAALFYTNFLGRNMQDVRQIEPYTGWSTAALARRLGCTVDDLYDRYSPSDNWQLVGASYAEDAQRHRTIGDLRLREVRPHLLELIDHAQRDLEKRFPEKDARQRIREWFADEQATLKDLLEQHADGRLVELYASWLQAHVPRLPTRLTSDLFDLDAGDERQHLLNLFLNRYDDMATLYNEALEESGSDLNRLQSDAGQLPFFAVRRHHGHLVRTGVKLADNHLVTDDGQQWPLRDGCLPAEGMQRDGVLCLPGKALLLVLQARLGKERPALALPYLGSLYMPAAYALQRKLQKRGYLPADLPPVLRVKFDFIRNWRSCDTAVRPPSHLHGVFSADELPASQLAAELDSVLQRARGELDAMSSDDGRKSWQLTFCAEAVQERDAVEARRRELVQNPETRDQAKPLWEDVKKLDRDILKKTADHAIRNLHILDLQYWNSRGAILPWSIALGGRAFYDKLLAQTRIYAETPDADMPPTTRLN